MIDLISAAVAEHIAEKLNRNVLVPVLFSNDFQPLTSNWHSIVEHYDCKTDLVTLLDTVDIFVGNVLIVPAFSGLIKCADISFLHLDVKGNERYSINTGMPQRKSLNHGLLYGGIFAGLRVSAYNASNAFNVKYEGFLLKC